MSVGWFVIEIIDETCSKFVNDEIVTKIVSFHFQFGLLKDVQKRLESLNNDASSGSKQKSDDDNNMQMSPEHNQES